MHNTIHSLNRRQFIKDASLASGALLGFPTLLRSQTLGNGDKVAANSRIGMGFIGTGGIAKGHLASFPGLPDVQPIAVCDVKDAMRSKAKGDLKRKGFTDVKSTPRYEEIIEDPSIDVVAIMTPDHWHAAIAIEAMKAGKDVYIEKPMTLTIEEGKAVVEAEKKYGRIVQVGSQQRSSAHFLIAANLVRNGKIGEVKEVICQLGTFPQPPENEEIVPVPEGIDYDRWLGPAPFHEYSEHRVKGVWSRGWRCYWDYGNRKFGDWGAHHFDIVQWALGRDETGPVRFVPKGFDGSKNHYYQYADGLKVWRDKGRLFHPTSEGKKRKPVMIRFVGTEGEVHVSRGLIHTKPEELRRHRFTDADIKLYKSTDHRKNFINSVKTREKTICPAGVGHRTGTICSLAAIAERLGREVKWDPATEQIQGDTEAQAMQSRERRAGYELPVV